MSQTDSILFDHLCEVMIPTVGQIVYNHLVAEGVPDAEEVYDCARDCGKMLASAWCEAIRRALGRHSGPGPMLLNKNLLPVTAVMDYKIYCAMLDSVSNWQLTEADVHYALTYVGFYTFIEQQTNFFLPFGMVLHQTASGYALSQRQI